MFSTDVDAEKMQPNCKFKEFQFVDLDYLYENRK